MITEQERAALKQAGKRLGSPEGDRELTRMRMMAKRKQKPAPEPKPEPKPELKSVGILKKKKKTNG